SGGKSGEHSKDYLSLFIKIILDGLNGVAYWDDSQVCRVYFEKMYAEKPETRVLIKNYEVC
ncbi:MAG: RusA family crossover junction endodeoxyribonuclease, partial [Bacilli bacterium]